MGSPTQHAFLSASSSHRWLECTAAPLYEAAFPDKGTSVYAEEGTLAHAVCELYATKMFGSISGTSFDMAIADLKSNKLFSQEMLRTAEFYADYLYGKYMAYKKAPYVAQEVRVDFSEYVPDGFGTCDSVMIGGSTLRITDYKHGKGVKVESYNNSQMRLYALGALNKYAPIYGDSITEVVMAIVQPRITEEVSEDIMSVADLRKWGEEYVKPRAHAAYTGEGSEFHSGEWCRFCAGKAQCKARALEYMALDAYTSYVPEGKLSTEDRLEIEKSKMLTGKSEVNTLTDDEVAAFIKRGEAIEAWVSDLKDYALKAILDGKSINGWKAVEGRSVRAFKDADAAMEALVGAGYEEALLYDRKAKSLSELEKMIGKKKFAEILGEQIVKPSGKPTLAIEGDRRPAYNPAAADLAGLKIETTVKL